MVVRAKESVHGEEANLLRAGDNELATTTTTFDRTSLGPGL